MLFGILNVSAAVLAPYQFLIMSFLCQAIILTINLATRNTTTQSVMSAAILSLQTLLVLLSTGRIPFGVRNTALLMNMMGLRDAAVVSEWSHERPDMLLLKMVESSVPSVSTQQ